MQSGWGVTEKPLGCLYLRMDEVVCILKKKEGAF